MKWDMNLSLISDLILEKAENNAYRYVDRFPHISQVIRKGERLDYKPEENSVWTSSFFPGEMYLGYLLTGEERFLQFSEKYLDSFEERLNKRIGISHDLGFLYTLSCVADYKLTGNRRAQKIALAAAEVLKTRFHEKGRYIQAWGEMNQGDPYVKIIADTMLNLPLLYWSGSEENIRIAEQHARTSAKYLVREDYSSYHTYLMNPQDGSAVEGRTHQGFRDSSTWARGQAWIVYGYALSYRYTGVNEFLSIAIRAADYFLQHLPADMVPYWDFTFHDRIPDIRDTSAASIFICGLLELSDHVEDGEQKAMYLRKVSGIIDSLYRFYLNPDMDSPVVLTDGMYHRDTGATGTIWGDYFFLEALTRMQTGNRNLW